MTGIVPPFRANPLVSEPHMIFVNCHIHTGAMNENIQSWAKNSLKINNFTPFLRYCSIHSSKTTYIHVKNCKESKKEGPKKLSVQQMWEKLIKWLIFHVLKSYLRWYGLFFAQKKKNYRCKSTQKFSRNPKKWVPK